VAAQHAAAAAADMEALDAGHTALLRAGARPPPGGPAGAAQGAVSAERCGCGGVSECAAPQGEAHEKEKVKERAAFLSQEVGRPTAPTAAPHTRPACRRRKKRPGSARWVCCRRRRPLPRRPRPRRRAPMTRRPRFALVVPARTHAVGRPVTPRRAGPSRPPRASARATTRSTWTCRWRTSSAQVRAVLLLSARPISLPTRPSRSQCSRRWN
jgi:hypothetical protein